MVSGFVVLLLAVGYLCAPQGGIVAAQKVSNFSVEGNDTILDDRILEKVENFTVKNELNSSSHDSENVSNMGDIVTMLNDDGVNDLTKTSTVFSPKKLSFVVKVTASNGTTTRTFTGSDRYDRDDSKTLRNEIKMTTASRYHTNMVNVSSKQTDIDDIDHLSTNESMPLNDGRNVKNSSGYEKQESSKENEATEQIGNHVSRQDASNTSYTSIIQAVNTKNLSEVDIDFLSLITYLDNNTVVESLNGIPHLETVVEDAKDVDGDDNDDGGGDDASGDDDHDDDLVINPSVSSVSMSEGNTSLYADGELIVTTVVKLSNGTNSNDVKVQQMGMKSSDHDDDDQGWKDKDYFHQIMGDVHKEAIAPNQKIIVGALPAPNSSLSPQPSSSPPPLRASSSPPVDLHVIDAKDVLDVQQDVVVKEETKEPSRWGAYSWVFMGGFMTALVVTGLCYLVARNRRTSTYRLRETFSI